ncbi:winged helix-turn-helix domain-containing protein [Nitrosopumilus sp. S6]
MVAQITDIKCIKLESSFKPSMTSLLRIFKVLTENGAKGKTQLSHDANLNYSRLAKHVIWMENKGFIKSTIKDNKINIVLTKNGHEFSHLIAETV